MNRRRSSEKAICRWLLPNPRGHASQHTPCGGGASASAPMTADANRGKRKTRLLRPAAAQARCRRRCRATATASKYTDRDPVPGTVESADLKAQLACRQAGHVGFGGWTKAACEAGREGPRRVAPCSCRSTAGNQDAEGPQPIAQTRPSQVRTHDLLAARIVGGAWDVRRMTEATVDVISAVEQACLAGADAAVRAGGFVPEPQVHMLIDDWGQPYVGCVRTRPYRQGVDALKAIARLADAPAAIMATRVVLVWEDADLRTSLHGPGLYANGLVVVDAGLTGEHKLRWHPMTLQVEGVAASGLPRVCPKWGISATVHSAVLPPIMTAVLNTWRALKGDPDTIFAELIAEGFPVRIMDR
jgi:hypothetical protein